MSVLCGIDLGGTKIEGVLLESAENPKVLHRMRIPTEAVKGYENIIGKIVELRGMLEKESGLKIERLGIGTPGALDPTSQTMKNSNTTCLNGQPFKKDLEEALGMSILMANDANCFALAEATMGIVPDEVPNAEVVFGVIMGTGVGGGVVVNGKVLNGRHGIGGEWGHNFLDKSGGKSYSGLHGNVETILAGPSLERYYRSIGGGESIRLPEIYQRHLDGTDPLASQTIQRLLTFFGKAIAYVINILDPDAVVLGGGVGNIDLLYTEGAKEAGKHVFNKVLETKFLKPKLGDSAGVFGAAMLWG
ncbi:ROK family protein [Flammeovirgaceae bacterium SG7u.111]|nr:ROK family protein [Flammeovirgaceae bacterium SG7u.132]WPO34647.1 ROK family protein [Flammeovirgaceae bacterium SG7u.111]